MNGQESRSGPEAGLRREYAVMVAAVATCASYERQRAFALRCGAGVTGASLWPLSVGGLLVPATLPVDRRSLLLAVELLASGRKPREPVETVPPPRDGTPLGSKWARPVVVGESEAVRVPGRLGA